MEKEIKVWYPKKNISPFSYGYNKQIEKLNYDEDGNFIDREHIEPSIEHYEVVGEHELREHFSNDEIFNRIVTQYNIGSYPSQISTKIRSGELNVGFSSFSTGCIIQLEGCYYISTGMGFDLLPLEFSNDE